MKSNHSMPDIISSGKASSHTTTPGQIYLATVTSVNSKGLVHIFIPELQVPFGPVLPLGSTPLNKCAVGENVMCAFTNEFFNNVVVFGSSRIKADVFADKLVVQAMQTTIASLNQRITALENA